MKEARYSNNPGNNSSFDETRTERSKTPSATMAAITPAKFDNSFWV